MPPKEYTAEFFTETLANWRDAEAQLKKTVALIIILAVVFELLTRGIGTDLTFSFIRITNVRLVEIYLPVIIAYETYNLCELFGEVQDYDAAVINILRELHPDVSTESSNFLLVPPNSLLTSTINLSAKGAFTAYNFVLMVLGFLKVAVIFILPLIFELYAFVSLFGKFGVGMLPTWLSLVLSAFLCLMAVLTWFAAFKAGGRFAQAIMAAIHAFKAGDGGDVPQDESLRPPRVVAVPVSPSPCNGVLVLSKSNALPCLCAP